MSAFKENDLKERLSTAADAKRAMLERFRAKPAADDPAVIEREEARKALAAARDARAAERKTAKEAEAARLAAEQTEREAEAARQADDAAVREATLKAEHEEREAALEAERKAARDARYAARKKRK
jgi:Family of unknown function (DUF6481)